MKYYTYKNINDYTKFMNEKETNKARAFLRIATQNGKLSKCNEAKFEIAKKLYFYVKKLNRLREFELNYDSIFMTKQRDYYNEKQSKIYNKILPLVKILNIEIYCGTWWHLCTKENQDIYF